MDNSFLRAFEEDDEIDFKELLHVLKSHILSIFLSLVGGAGIALFVTVYLIKPVYTSSSMIYIFSKTTSVTSALDLQIGKQLTVDFEILGTSRPGIEKVISELELDTTYEELLKTVTISNPTDSRIIKITASNQDPELACDIANCLANNLALRVAEVIDTTKPSSVEDAVPAIKPSKPDKKKNTMLGGLIGMMIAIFVILFKYYSDTSIHTEEDVRKYLDLGTLAAIPYEKSVSAENSLKKVGNKFK